jgi:hypothetical protein
MEETKIKWCEVCGSIVGDIDSDNRTYPGAVFKIQAPEISKVQSGVGGT